MSLPSWDGRSVPRRTLFKAAAASVALTASGRVLGAPAQAASPHFDLSRPSYDFFPRRDVPLHEAHRIMQSFAFDNRNQRLFVAQLQNGSSGDDLCLTELSLQGEVLGWMHLDRVGHGVSIAVEAVGGRSFIWTEAASSSRDQSGRGTALQRFEFVSGRAPSDVRTFLRGSAVVTCAIDQVHSRMLVRRWARGRMRLSVHRLAAAVQGDFSNPVHDLAMPGVGGVFQGYTLHGKHMYVLTGRGHDDQRHADSRLSCIDLETGAVVQRGVRTRAGSSLEWREPEGMAVHVTPSGQVRLCFGMASRVGNQRRANIFYKDALVG